MLTLLTATAVAGCGGAGGPAGVTAGTAPSPTVATTPAAERVTVEPTPVLRRHDTPPGGLRRLVDYYQQGDGPPCTHLDDDAAERGPLRFLFRPDRIVEPKHDPGTVVSVGDLLGVCLAGSAAAVGDATLSIDAPGVDPVPAEVGTTRFGANSHLTIRSEHGVGTWRFTARAGGETAEATLRVGATPEPAYRVVESIALLYGMEPRQPFQVALYEPGPTSTTDGVVTNMARYVASAPGRTGADGSAAIPIDAERLLDECGFVKVQVAGRLLYDAYNMLSNVCPPPSETYASVAEAPPGLLARRETPPPGVPGTVAHDAQHDQLPCDAPQPRSGDIAIGAAVSITPRFAATDPPALGPLRAR